MRIEDIQELEDALERQPSWDPPPGFVRRVTLLGSSASHGQPAPEPRRGGFLAAATAGLGGAIILYVIGSVGTLVVPAVIHGTVTTVDSYTTFVELTTRVLTARAVQAAWISAGLSLSFAASLVLRARA